MSAWANSLDHHMHSRDTAHVAAAPKAIEPNGTRGTFPGHTWPSLWSRPLSVLTLLLVLVLALSVIQVLPPSSYLQSSSTRLGNLVAGFNNQRPACDPTVKKSQGLPPLPLCPAEIFRNIQPIDDHGYTNRGFERHVAMHPPFMNVTAMIAEKPNATILEIGTGAGHALLDLQAAFPYAHIYGTNYAKYNLPQATNSSGLLAAAKRFNISVHCTPDGKPVLPTALLMPSIVEADLTKIHDPESLDFVLSVHALNNKLDPADSHKYIPKIMHMLSPGGIAVMHVGDLTRIHGLEQPFYVTHSWTVTHPLTKARYSVVLYLLACCNAFSMQVDTVGMLIRRCTSADALNQNGDCIVPDDLCDELQADLSQLHRKAEQAISFAGTDNGIHTGYMRTWTNIIDKMNNWDSVVTELIPHR